MTATPRSLIAAEVAASGGKAAHEVADCILARLRGAGFDVSKAPETDAYVALTMLDAVLDFPADQAECAARAKDIGILGPQFLHSACVAARQALNAPLLDAALASYRTAPAAA